MKSALLRSWRKLAAPIYANVWRTFGATAQPKSLSSDHQLGLRRLSRLLRRWVRKVRKFGLPRARATLPPDRATLKGEDSKPTSEKKLLRLYEIFCGTGAVITNLARFSDWERWNYDCHLDIEPTMREIAARKGPNWAPAKLIYFDQPIAERRQARLTGIAPQPRRGRQLPGDEEIMAAIERGLNAPR